MPKFTRVDLPANIQVRVDGGMAPFRRVYDHEVLMSFFDDAGAEEFRSWWSDEGAEDFARWLLRFGRDDLL